MLVAVPGNSRGLFSNSRGYKLGEHLHRSLDWQLDRVLYSWLLLHDRSAAGTGNMVDD